CSCLSIAISALEKTNFRNTAQNWWWIEEGDARIASTKGQCGSAIELRLQGKIQPDYLGLIFLRFEHRTVHRTSAFRCRCDAANDGAGNSSATATMGLKALADRTVEESDSGGPQPGVATLD